jgi:STE24 endopeptidase
VLGLRGREDAAGLPLIVAAAAAVSLVLMPIGLALSRRHERRADRFALDLTGNPAAFLTAMRRLGAQNMAESTPHASRNGCSTVTRRSRRGSPRRGVEIG